MRVRPSIRLAALPSALSYAERFRMAAEAGFEGVELEAGLDPPEAVRDAAAAAGIVVHSVHSYRNWSHPLTSADPKVAAEGLRHSLAALEEAKLLGAQTYQLIPGRARDGISYREAYDRSQAVIRAELLPAAAGLGIVLGIENVWNGFLLGPLEYAQYCDSFDSPWVRPYLDIGNPVFGRPEDWIELCGPRLVALHLKDFRLDTRDDMHLRFDHLMIGEGMVDWPAVRAALDRAGFDGWGVFAQAEHLQGAVASSARRWAHRARRLPLAGAAQAFLARRLLGEVIGRHRRFLA
jgi:L-ribulose-5-phosphate 3-epimerase